MAKETTDKKVGRPSKKDDEGTFGPVSKLLAAFWRGANITEACNYAGISRETYYQWCKEMPELSDSFAAARTNVSEKAKAIIVDAIEKGDINAAKWWLERRNKQEFGPNAVDTYEEPSETDKLEVKLQANISLGIANKYRVYLFRKREQLLSEYSKKNEHLAARIDKLIKLPDKELADYAGLEVWATGADPAGVRRELIIRQGGENYKDIEALADETVAKYDAMMKEENSKQYS